MKKIELGKLKLNKNIVAKLNDNEMISLNGGGVARSRRRDGDCRYSRNNYTQCTSANKISKSGACCQTE